MNASRNARERVRAELTREIVDLARAQLATAGPAGLSLRAVAREMGMVSSAVYRYFPSRDDLLTTLIIEGYQALGAAVEKADDPGAAPAVRLLAVARAIRSWALDHPHEYALLYGTPVPGYAAPADTVDPAALAAARFGAILADAVAAGTLHPPDVGAPPPPAGFAPVGEALRVSVMAGVPDEVAARALGVWTGIFGMVSFELFGQFENVVVNRDEVFAHTITCWARYLGL